MRTLNDIPDSLRDDRHDNWTPGRGLVKGTIWTLVAALPLAAALFAGGYYISPVVNHWALGVVLAGFVTGILFAVMHHAAGMTGSLCTAIVVGSALLVLIARTAGTAWHGSEWTLFRPEVLLMCNLTSLIGVGFAVALCKDGDSVIHSVADMAMTNPFTGRR